MTTVAADRELGENVPAKFRLLLDTNIWRYVVDAGASVALAQLPRSQNIQIQIAPSVVYEALKTSDKVLRRRLLATMTKQEWQRLMPEAYGECQELISEIKGLRPEWLNSTPTYQHFNRFRHDWLRKRGGFWDRARCETASEAAKLNTMDGRMRELAREGAEASRETFRDAGQTVDNVSLGGMSARPIQDTPGWKGDDIEVWRLAGMQQLDLALDTSFGYCTPYEDWLSAEIDCQALRANRQSWVQFWFYDIRANRMPKFWIRSAFEILQSVRKISSGTPCDTQLATHLTESDCFITADKVFHRVAALCREAAPFSLAKPYQVSAGSSVIEELLRVIENVKASRLS